MSADHQHSILARTIFCGLLKVILDVILIQRHGLQGALAAYVSIAVVSMITTMILALRVSGGSLPWGRLGRVLLALMVASAIAFPLRGLALPLVAMLGGGALLTVLYAVLTIVLGCWSLADIDYLKSLHSRFAAERPAVLAHLLDWAGARAAKDYL